MLSWSKVAVGSCLRHFYSYCTCHSNGLNLLHSVLRAASSVMCMLMELPEYLSPINATHRMKKATFYWLNGIFLSWSFILELIERRLFCELFKWSFPVKMDSGSWSNSHVHILRRILFHDIKHITDTCNARPHASPYRRRKREGKGRGRASCCRFLRAG